MRWLLLKDLQILRRSPLIVALLVVYPIALGVLIGFALSGDEGKQRVAFLNQVPETDDLQLGDDEGGLDKGIAREELCARVDCVDVDSRAEAAEKVEEGDVVAALILPPDLIDKIESLASLNPQQPIVEVLVNEDDPIKADLVDDRIKALVTEANLVLSQRISDQAASYLDLLIEGGRFALPFLGELDILGLERAGQILEAAAGELDPDSPERAALDRVTRFAGLARENLDFALPLLGAVAEPIAVDKVVVAGDCLRARHLRDRGRRGGDPDVRHRAARRRLARARARGERVRPDHPRRGRAHRVAGREDPARRARLARRHPADARGADAAGDASIGGGAR